jgi:hypothetical protein
VLGSVTLTVMSPENKATPGITKVVPRTKIGSDTGKVDTTGALLTRVVAVAVVTATAVLVVSDGLGTELAAVRSVCVVCVLKGPAGSADSALLVSVGAVWHSSGRTVEHGIEKLLAKLLSTFPVYNGAVQLRMPMLARTAKLNPLG